MKVINKIKNKFARRNSDTFIKYLRENGCKIGENTHFHDVKSVFIDVNRLNFIEIGKNCNITMNVIILAHDYSYKVCRNVYGDMPQKSGVTKIGNNVFVGMNSIILMGAEIGNNVIVGAGSVVSGKIPDNCVVAGNPARVICTLDKYHEKCVKNFEENAKIHAKRILETKKRNPTINEMLFYSLLFLKQDEEREMYLHNINMTGDNKKEVIKDLMKIKNKYDGFDEFMESVREN